MSHIRISDQIAENLERMIADGSLQPAERLPSERKLSEQMQVSRTALREAIQKLNSKGLVYTRQGGGTYISEGVNPEFVAPLVQLLKDHPETRFDVLEMRHALEGTAAYYAALRGTDEDKVKIQSCYRDMLAGHGRSNDPMDEARADAAFHLTIVEASHNLVLLHVMRGLFNLLQSSISHNLDKLYTLPRVFQPLNQQHERLMQCIMRGEPDQARQAAQAHLEFVTESLQRIDREDTRAPTS
jgi:DNA-binding FadR family transcriptional regulator